MDPITVLITGAGAPGIKGTIYSLKKNFDKRKVSVVGTDIKTDVVGKYLCDSFYNIPRPTYINNYLDTLLSICRKEKIDIILPQNTAELLLLASNKNLYEEVGSRVVISNESSIKTANNKFELLKICKKISVSVPKFYLAKNINDLINFAEKLGWPDNRIVVKPPISNGLRGLRIIDENIDLKKMFYEKKPTSLYIKISELENILGETFPDLIVSEYLPKDEYTVDVLRTKDGVVVIPRKRDMIRSGITFTGTTERQEDIIECSHKLSEKLGLEYCFGFQFKLDENHVPKILECNPRVQGTMVLATFAGANIIYGAVKSSLGEQVPKFDIKWGTRMFRYWGGIGTYMDKSLACL